MSLSTRPQSHAERDQIISAIMSYITRTDADPALVAAEAAGFTETRAAYQSARSDWQTATGEADAAADRADGADAAFDRDLRLFVASVRDEQGRPSPRTIADMMGGLLPSELTRKPYREEVQRARDLLTRLSGREGLDLDEDRVAALAASVDALEAAADANEAAQRVARSAGVTLTEAIAEFDQRYGKLVRRWVALSEEGVVEGLLPRFVRSSRRSTSTDAPTPS